MSGTAGILLFSGAPLSWTTSGRTRGEGLRQHPNRRDRILAQGQDDGLLLMSLEGLYVTGRLGLRERAKGEWFSGNLEIRSHRIDEL